MEPQEMCTLVEASTVQRTRREPTSVLWPKLATVGVWRFLLVYLEAGGPALDSLSNSSSARNQSAVGASITRKVWPPFAWFAGQTSTHDPQPMQRLCTVVTSLGSDASYSRFAFVGQTG